MFAHECPCHKFQLSFAVVWGVAQVAKGLQPSDVGGFFEMRDPPRVVTSSQKLRI